MNKPTLKDLHGMRSYKLEAIANIEDYAPGTEPHAETVAAAQRIIAARKRQDELKIALIDIALAQPSTDSGLREVRGYSTQYERFGVGAAGPTCMERHEIDTWTKRR